MFSINWFTTVHVHIHVNMPWPKNAIGGRPSQFLDSQFDLHVHVHVTSLQYNH